VIDHGEDPHTLLYNIMPDCAHLGKGPSLPAVSICHDAFSDSGEGH
jgi:hypothetical protein